jgi:hypothetical protein
MPIYNNRMRNLDKQGRPDLDINQLARNVREAYRGTPSYVQPAGVSASTSPTAFENQPLEVALPPAKQKPKGRPVGSKNKPKPITEETQTGPSLPNTPKPKKQKKIKQVIEIGDEGAFATAGKGGLRGKAEEID